MTATTVWAVPETAGGIADYAARLWPGVVDSLGTHGGRGLDPIIFDGGRERERFAALDQLVACAATVIHVHHEYGLFGRKLPGLYHWPAWLAELRRRLPDARVVATAHTVLDPSFRYDAVGPWPRRLIAPVANRTYVPRCRELWGPRTWRDLDAVVVHSDLQADHLRAAQARRVTVIPLFVPAPDAHPAPDRPAATATVAADVITNVPRDAPVIVVFGFLSAEKGQDIAVRALSMLTSGQGRRAHLVLAGASRRGSDRPYARHCRSLAQDLGVGGRVHITGFVPPEQIAALMVRATVVLAPFRRTSGSASIPEAFAHSAPVIASDLPLNVELNRRVAGCVDLFRVDDAGHCAERLDVLLNDEPLRGAMSAGAARYAAKYSLAGAAHAHVDLYRSLGAEHSTARISAIVLNYNRADDTLKCAASLSQLVMVRHPDVELTVRVVDNGSTDGSVQRLREGLVSANLLESPTNAGFAAGNNVGVLDALEHGADIVWLLNNDTEVEPDALDAILDAFQRAPHIGAVGTTVRTPPKGSGPVQAVGGGRVWPWLGRSRLNTEGGRLDYLSGASLALRGDALRDAGLLDEGFFFYWEDVDLSWRLRSAGWRLAVADGAVVWHSESGTVGAASPRHREYALRSLVRFARKHSPIPLIPAGVGLVDVVARDLLKRRWVNLPAAVRGWRDGWRQSDLSERYDRARLAVTGPGAPR